MQLIVTHLTHIFFVLSFLSWSIFLYTGSIAVQSHMVFFFLGMLSHMEIGGNRVVYHYLLV